MLVVRGRDGADWPGACWHDCIRRSLMIPHRTPQKQRLRHAASLDICTTPMVTDGNSMKPLRVHISPRKEVPDDGAVHRFRHVGHAHDGRAMKMPSSMLIT